LDCPIGYSLEILQKLRLQLFRNDIDHNAFNKLLLATMGEQARKRSRDDGDGAVPVKRRRQINEDQLKLSKLYEDLAAESDDVRFEAAKQLIVKFSPVSKPAAKDVENALARLIKGLCSQRKAARVGFSLTLTELLREIFGQKNATIEGLDLNVASLIKLIEEKTKVEGNVPGRVSTLTASWKPS
jgi:DNA polymerase phi